MPRKTDLQVCSPLVVKTAMKSVEKRKRARMGAESTPDQNQPPRKRKATTRARALKDVLNVMEKTDQPSIQNFIDKENKDGETCAVVVAKKSSVTSDNKTGPSSRWGHSFCLITEAEAMLIGGQGGSGDKKLISKDAIWHLDIVKGIWNKPDTDVTSGQKPETRMGHTAVHDPTVRCIYVYGGSKNIKWYNDVHVLELDTMKWELVKAVGKAPTRAYHSTTLYRHELWIFGGVYPRPDPQPDGCSNDLHVYSPMEQSWYDPIVMGEKPIQRSGHSATLLEDRLVVFGGWDAPVCYNDLNVLDLVLLEWTKPVTNGKPPSPRSWHASCALSGRRLMVHGGYNGNDALSDSFIFNLDSLTWTEIKLDPSLPARAGHTALCLPYKHTNENNDQILIFGGGDNEGSFYQDLVDIMLPWEEGAKPIGY